VRVGGFGLKGHAALSPMRDALFGYSAFRVSPYLREHTVAEGPTR